MKRGTLKDPDPSEDIYGEIEAAGGFSDFDAGVSDLPLFREVHRHQNPSMFGGQNHRRGVYTRDPAKYYLLTGKAPRGHQVEDLRRQVDQEIAAEQQSIAQMYEE